MNILLIGGLGHIGSYLIHDFLEFKNNKYNITVVDNLSTQRYCSLRDLDPAIKFIEEDFNNLTHEFLGNFDIIIHLAAITDAANSFKNKKLIKKINIKDTKKLIDKVSQLYTEPKFIFPSSTSIYGESKKTTHEGTKTDINPQSPYAQSKVKIEQYLNNSTINYTILRFGTIFGTSKGMRFHTAINKFCYQARFGQPLTIWEANYNMSRPYLGLKDCATSILSSINCSTTNKETYNVLSNNIQLSTIINSIKEQCPEIELNFVDSPLLNQYEYSVSWSKIKKDTGFDPECDINNGIIETLKWLGFNNE